MLEVAARSGFAVLVASPDDVTESRGTTAESVRHPGVRALLDKDTDALTLRLRSRAAALLGTDLDPSSAVFADAGLLYGLRSKVVHGGQLTEKDLRKALARVSTVPAGTADDALGLALAYGVDRLRDLVRRAVLARLCLADRASAPWPLATDGGVDGLLSDDAVRFEWRARWHDHLAGLGAAGAGERPRAAVPAVSRDDR